jgi:hypothetical protein
MPERGLLLENDHLLCGAHMPVSDGTLRIDCAGHRFEALGACGHPCA